MSFWLVGAGFVPRGCAGTLPFFGKDILMLSFIFFRGGDGVEEGLEAIDTFLGSLESKVMLEEISQETRLGSVSA